MELWKTHSVIGTKASGLSLTKPSWLSQHDQPTTLHTLVFASVLLFCVAVAGVIYWRTHSQTLPTQVAQSAPVAVTIDLSQAGTTRGTEPATLPAVILPRRVDTTHVILPNFSPGGNYVVSVTTDRNSASEKATGHAVANVHGFHTDLTVALDLRSLPQGTYYLATTHEGDPASYFYPLTVR